VPDEVPVGTTIDPDTWPVLPEREHPGVPIDGTVMAVQNVAAELNPEPVNVNTVFTVPEVGVTTTSGITVNAASGVKSFTGDPTTFTFHAISLVA
jgi:hypothetical protein